jgi:mono/diheme cytochrome c family protein
MRHAVLICALLFLVSATLAQKRPGVNPAPFSPSYMPSGQEMYGQFCAACHGTDAKGHGPSASSLKAPPPDLTKLSIRNKGKFPVDYIADILRFGPGVPAHGSYDMPTWGPIFHVIEKGDEQAVRERIKRISDYLSSLQEK